MMNVWESNGKQSGVKSHVRILHELPWIPKYRFSTTGEFNGYVWSASIGWIHLGDSVGVRVNTQTDRVLVPQTGGTGSGAPWPQPRFTDNGNGTVTDNLTGLIWLKDASCQSLPNTESDGQANWKTAKSAAAALANGTCGLTNQPPTTTWRLPTLRELQSLVNYAQNGPALSDGTPFTGVILNKYWSSTVNNTGNTRAWYVEFNYGKVSHDRVTGNNYVWPMRGGE